MTRTTDEAAKWFSVENTAQGANVGQEIYPGYPGMVVADGQIRTMAWGFPLQRKGTKGQLLKPKPVNNARSDKLSGFFWRSSFEKRRCLIPLTGWAEAQGPRGAMTRTWLSVPGADQFSCAGIWRSSDEWGDVYSMVMTEAAGVAAEVHSRMPVLLAPENYADWLMGDPAAALELCTPWAGDLTIDRTGDPWTRSSQTQLF